MGRRTARAFAGLYRFDGLGYLRVFCLHILFAFPCKSGHDADRRQVSIWPVHLVVHDDPGSISIVAATHVGDGSATEQHSVAEHPAGAGLGGSGFRSAAACAARLAAATASYSLLARGSGRGGVLHPDGSARPLGLDSLFPGLERGLWKTLFTRLPGLDYPDMDERKLVRCQALSSLDKLDYRRALSYVRALWLFQHTGVHLVYGLLSAVRPRWCQR